ncbi:MAG: DUF1353 domain-containing protein [Nocardioides sp.]
MHISRVQPQVRRFYDGGTFDSPPHPDCEPRIVLERLTEDDAETFALERRIGYADRELAELLVPAGPEFRTDLTSVPWLFTWLVPKTGAHLPAALLHDGLVGGHDDPASYVSTEGHVVTRDVADRVFRDAMADTGTGVVRRWLVWAAVATATMFVGSEAWSRGQLWRHRLAAGSTVAVILGLGAVATLDLFDLGPLTLPWMGERSLLTELVGGLAGAVALPVLISLAWGRFRMAGAILGVLLAVLLHVSVALLLLTGLYQAVEWAAKAAPAAAMVVAASVVTLSLVVLALYAWG